MKKKIRRRLLHITIFIGLIVAEVASVFFMHERALELAESHIEITDTIFLVYMLPLEIVGLLILGYKKKRWALSYMITIIIWSIAMIVATDVSCPVCGRGG